MVDLTEPWERMVSDQELLARFGPSIPWLRLPTPDYAAPHLADLRTAIAFIEEQTRAGWVRVGGGEGLSGPPGEG